MIGGSGDPRGGDTRTYLQLALGMAAFGSATPISKIVATAMPVFVASALRVGLGAVALAPCLHGRWRQISTMQYKDWLLIAGIALFGMFGFSVFMLYGMQLIPGVVGAIVMSATPAVTALASVLFLNERLTWRKVLATSMAVCGVVILQSGGGLGGSDVAHMWLGIGLVFAAVCCEAAYTLLGKVVSEQLDPTLVAFLASSIGAALFLPFAIWQWNQLQWEQVDLRTWLALGWYGIGTLAVGTWLWYSGVRKTQGSVAAGFMGIMPVSALILSYVLLGDAFAWRHLLGFGVVFGGVLLISREHAQTGRHRP